MTGATSTEQAVSGIDHLLTPVRDLDDAARRMQRLGFTVSPRGLHSPHLGSANHTIMFERDYIELWGLVTPTPFNAIHRQNLALGEGLHAVAITAEDIGAVRRNLAAAGIASDEPVPHQRPVATAQGSGEARFIVLRPERGELPAGFMFYCQHLTPELVWMPELIRHANGTRAIAALVIAAEDPAATAAIYTRLFAGRPPQSIAGGARVATGKAMLDFLAPAAIAARYGMAGVAGIASPFYKVVRLAVEDLGRAQALLLGNGIRLIVESDRLLLSPDQACGLLLEMVAA